MPSTLYQQYQPNGSLSDQVQQLKTNPMGAVLQRFNMPQGMKNPNDILQYLINTNQVQIKVPQNIKDPNDILQYLLNTGQISQQQVNSAMQMYNTIR